MIGDLKDGVTSSVGSNISKILQGSVTAQDHDGGYVPPGTLNDTACKTDTCCVWSYIAAEIYPFFQETNGTCNQWARRAIRLGFHDAAGWSKPNAAAGNDYGGADGSIALSAEEAGRQENKGLSEIISKVQEWQQKYGVGMADLIQFASNVATVTCPLGPRVRTFVGRIDSTTPAPAGLLPDVFDSADKLICLFADKTISAGQLTALVGAHSTSQQFFVDPSKAGQPQDDTPGVFDTNFYTQHRPGASKLDGVFQFQSDVLLARDTRTKGRWAEFSIFGAPLWGGGYATAYVRLSLLGVNNINNLTECSHVLPKAHTSFP
ncbi:class II peroxidase [Glonium stellatum]|uniref:Peroxidase n=1 Tax=Glonium stellatum TaxID=574774 RepID=A0A8E2F392_9PEZI|nr:class II peroxidase [Glonium stellatum]